MIYSPHDRLVTTETRFWNASGFSFNVGPSGAQLDFSSVASLISGGVTFDTLVSGGAAVGQSAVFEVYPNEATARRSVFEDTGGLDLRVQAVFSENISGLSSGANVEWRGLATTVGSPSWTINWAGCWTGWKSQVRPKTRWWW